MNIQKLRDMNLHAVADELERLREFKAKVESQEPRGYELVHSDAIEYFSLFHEVAQAAQGGGEVVPVYAKPVPADKPARITEQDAREIISSYEAHYKDDSGFDWWFRDNGPALLNKLNADREQVPAVDEETSTNYCALNTINDDQVRKVVRAFWRRIYPFRNDYGIELPTPMPVEFMAHMATALTWVDKPVPADKPVTRQDVIDVLLSTRGQPEGVTADAILGLLPDKGTVAVSASTTDKPADDNGTGNVLWSDSHSEDEILEEHSGNVLFDVVANLWEDIRCLKEDKPAVSVPDGYASRSSFKVFSSGNAEGLVIYRSKTDERFVPVFFQSHSQQGATAVAVPDEWRRIVERMVNMMRMSGVVSHKDSLNPLHSWLHDAESLLDAPSHSQKSAPIPWIPVLRNRADGVDGHYAIGRFNPSGYWEFWNLISHKWASASNKVLSLDEANDLLKQLVFPSHESEQGGEK